MLRVFRYLGRRTGKAARELRRNQRGAQTIEWVALGILVLAIMAGAATAVSNEDTGLGKKLVEFMGRLLDKAGSDAPAGGGGSGGSGG